MTREQPRADKRRRESKYWWAARARDARWDGSFVFAVRSTGIYCRPSCPARRPARKQVIFFALPEAAEQAGFRPCRRCQPREAPARNPSLELVRRVCRTIETDLEEPYTLQTLGLHMGVSPGHLQRTFKRLMGITPRQYADARRLDKLKGRLREGHNVTRALYEAGYGSSSRLYEQAAAQLGMTPATYRRGGRGMEIGYTIVKGRLGRLLVAATERGICMVSLGDAAAQLAAALRREYPNATIHREASGVAPWAKTIQKYLRGNQPRLNLPLDVEATAFQRRVWEELRRIPYGSTRSYKDVARAIGQPRAVVRAVARACATNPVSLVIPCHRVLRSDGSLGGYRWGLGRKRALLETESRQCPRPASAAAHRSFFPETRVK